uniref:Uncharacterized protein n=1 Tax=viral metagenome TaxID=1070528 RepID=A0A6M3LVV2_9ZZZZ
MKGAAAMKCTVPVLILQAGVEVWVYAPKEVESIVINQDRSVPGFELQAVQPGIGFEPLMAEAGLEDGKDFVWKGGPHDG